MTPRERLVTVREGAGTEEITSLLHRHRIEKVLVINDRFELKGMVTVKDIHKARNFPIPVRMRMSACGSAPQWASVRAPASGLLP